MNYVFIHGLGQKPSSWDKVTEDLPKDIQLYCPCLSAMVKGQAVVYEALYKAFEDKCNLLQPPLCLCGISLGAIMALHYAINNAPRVKSLILIAPQYKMPQLLLTIQNIVFHAIPKKKFTEIGFSKSDMISLTKSMRQLDFTPLLKNITCPVFIINGEQDMVNKKAAKMLAERISDAQLLFVKGAGHEVNESAPVKLANLVKRFWFNES